MSYLSVCAVFRDEARYLREWIEFHRLVGAERFFLYNNRSSDDYELALEPYVAAGLVELRDWPDYPGQCTAYADCLERHREDARWIAFIDLDEFLFSPLLVPVPQVLADYEEFPGVGVNWAMFGSSGHSVAPKGLVIENYVKRADDPNICIKSVVDPRRTLRSAGGVNPHAFQYEDGFAVNELMKPIDRQPFGHSDPGSFSRLRINHYWTKSEEEWRKKMMRPMAHVGKKREVKLQRFPFIDAGFSTVADETILAYAPALHNALERPASPGSAALLAG